MKKPVLDACCGSRSFWFDKKDPRAVFLDKRRERHTLNTRRSRGPLHLVIEPDVQADFTKLPFREKEFSLVVFDPPHLTSLGKTSWYAKKAIKH